MLNQTVTISKDNNHLRKKIWLVRWYSDFDSKIGKAKRYSKSFVRKIDAENYKEEKEREFASGMTRANTSISLEIFCQKYLKAKKSALAIKSFWDYEDTVERLLKYFNSNCDVKSIRNENAASFISDLELVHPDHKRTNKQLADLTRLKILKNCKQIFKIANQWGYIIINPFADIRLKKPRKKAWYYIKPDEFKTILNSVPGIRQKGKPRKENIHVKAFYSIMYGCGLRSGESLNLLWEGGNIDFENKRIHIVNRSAKMGIPPFYIKDIENRSVPMPNWVADILLKLKAETNGSCPFVFLTEERWARVIKRWERMQKAGEEDLWCNDLLENNTVRNFRKHCELAGIKTNNKLMIHCLRKSYACNLANSSVPIQTLQKLGGWSDIKTCQSTDANELKAVEALDRMMEG